MAGSSWTNQAFNQVIVFGPNGGVFIYSGTPKHGNPPIFWATSATQDQFGNALPSTAGVASSGTFRAGNTIISPSGTVAYSGTPAANNMVSSSSPSAFTDSFGNNVLQGQTFFFQGGPTFFALNINGGNIDLFSATSQTVGWGAATAAIAFNQSPNALTLTNNTALEIEAMASPPAAPVSNTAVLWANTNATPSGMTQNGLFGQLALTGGDTSTQTNATTSLNAMSKVWPVPANDPSVNTVYRLTVFGTGTQGSTQEDLQFRLSVLGVTAGSGTMAGSVIAAGAAFNWKYTATVLITATGAPGTAVVESEFKWTQTSASVTGSNSATGTEIGTAAAVNTTANGNVTFQAAWSSITGGPTITSAGSVFERLGG